MNRYIYRELTFAERTRLRTVRRAIMLIAVLMGLILFGAGCTTVVTPTGEKVTFIESKWSIINNTGYDLDVIQDGVKIARLSPGQTTMIPPAYWRSASMVSVSAYSNGRYMGANHYTFSHYVAFNWQVNYVEEPGAAR